MRDEAIIANIYSTQSYDSIMCGYYRIGFINYMLKGNSLTDFNNLFLPNMNHDIINHDIMLSYFLNKL